MVDDPEVIEIPEDLESASSDLESLLAAVNSKNFSLATGLVEEPAKFEKVDSFFELVKDENSEAKILDDSVETSPDDILEEPEVNESNEAEQDKQLDELSVDLDNDETSPLDDELTDVTDGTFDKNETTDPAFEVLEQPTSTSETSDTLKTPDSVEGESDQPVNSNVTESIIETAAFDRGYQSAILEFEKAMELEKKALSDLGSVMFKIENNLKDNLSEMLKKNIINLSSKFIGSKIDEMPEQFVDHIQKCADEIFFEAREIKVHMNHSDFELINSILSTNELDLQIIVSSELRRGEFELSSHGSGLKQKFAD